MSTAYIIYDKYANAINNELLETGRRDSIHIDAVRLALRLALDELAEPIPPTPSTDVHTTEKLGTANLRIMELQADLERLQTATNAEVAELRSQLAQLDADNAALIRRNKELADDLHIARNGTELVIKNPPFVDGNGAAQSPISNLQSSMWTDPDMLHLLDDEAKDWWIGVSAGRHIWRTVPKPVQLRMVRHVLSFGPETGSMTMAEFDAIKPGFMPGSGSHTKTLSLSWQQLNDWSVEL